MIARIKDVVSEWHVKEKEIEDTFLSYFSKLFYSSKPINMDRVFKAIGTRVTEEMNGI